MSFGTDLQEGIPARLVKIGISAAGVIAGGTLLLYVVGPRIWGRTTGSPISTVDLDIWGIKQALELFQHDCGFYPADLADLVANKDKSVNCGGRYNPDGYLDKIPVDPWGRPYIFLSDGHRYLIESYGADGQRGGRGKDADVESRNF